MPLALRKIDKWLKSKGYHMRRGQRYECHWELKMITYRPQDSLQAKIRGLLHECGHVLCERGTTTRFKTGYPAARVGAQRTRRSRADIIHEELEAWHRGYALGKKLGIRVDEEAFWVDYGKCIMIKCKKALARTL